MDPLPRVREEEWMDRPGVDPGELRRALAYIRGVNRLLGYNRATRARVAGWLRDHGPGDASVLDVATGSGDVPADLLSGLGARHRLRVVGLDLHALTIAEARDRVPEVSRAGGLGGGWVRGDAMRLPFADGAFDYAMTSMFVHHLDEEDVVRVLAELWRVARRGVLVADLLRDRRALTWIRLGTLLASPMVRHDAVVSVRQAFTLPEITALCRRAGWEDADARTHFAHRFTVVGTKRPKA